MKNLMFGSNDCVKIENKEQYNSIRHLLRNNREMERELENPIYLERAISVTRGSSIGITHYPIGTWSREPLNVISFDEATND